MDFTPTKNWNNLKQATFAYFCLLLQQNSENRPVACYKLQYLDFDLVNFQKLNSSCSRDGSSFWAKLERTDTTITFFFFWNADNIFNLHVVFIIVCKECCLHFLFMKCGQHFHVVRIVFCKTFCSHCPHFLLMKCRQHLFYNYWCR